MMKKVLGQDGKMRAGRFRVHNDMLTPETIECVAAVLREVIVVRCEHRWEKRAFEYVALCPQFDEVPLGEDAPEYVATVNTEIGEDGSPEYSVQWKHI